MPGALCGADICRDLAILPGTASDPVGGDLFLVICEYGGDSAPLLRLPPFIVDPDDWPEAALALLPPGAVPVPLLEAATGPP